MQGSIRASVDEALRLLEYQSFDAAFLDIDIEREVSLVVAELLAGRQNALRLNEWIGLGGMPSNFW